MILLLDAHALLWWLTDDRRLSDAARRSIAESANVALASAASIWELEIKRAVGKLQAPDDLLELLESEAFDCLPIHGDDAITAARLPLHHRDPFDRMILAQAVRLEAVVVSRDQIFNAYDVPVLRA